MHLHPRTKRAPLALSAVCALLASCALGPMVSSPNTRLPMAFEASAGVSGDQAGLERWWTRYGDAQLEALVDRALVLAPDARSALAKLKEAGAVRSSALADYNPQGAIQASNTGINTSILSGGKYTIPGTGVSIPFTNSGWTTAKSATFNISWEIDLFGRRAATRRKADADLAAARFDYAASRAALAANVADSLFQARGLAIQLDDARATERIERDLSDIAHKKADHGLGIRADADQADAEMAQAAAQTADLESQLHVARRTLLILVGRGADRLDSLPTPAVAGVAPPLPASVPGQLLARRPDVREAAAKLKSAAGQLKLDELAVFPKFSLQPGVGLSSSTGGFAPSITDMWSIGLGLAQPVLDLPRLRAEVRAQGARVDQAAIAYEKTVQTAFGEAENALVELGSDETRVRLLTTGEAQARSAYDFARKGYSAGINDLTTTLSAERTWRIARTALTDAQVQALRRSVQAFKALGGGWPVAPVKMHSR